MDRSWVETVKVEYWVACKYKMLGMNVILQDKKENTCITKMTGLTCGVVAFEMWW